MTDIIKKRLHIYATFANFVTCKTEMNIKGSCDVLSGIAMPHGVQECDFSFFLKNLSFCLNLFQSLRL